MDIGADGATIVRSEVDKLVGVGVEIWGKGVEGEGDVDWREQPTENGKPTETENGFLLHPLEKKNIVVDQHFLVASNIGKYGNNFSKRRFRLKWTQPKTVKEK